MHLRTTATGILVLLVTTVLLGVQRASTATVVEPTFCNNNVCMLTPKELADYERRMGMSVPTGMQVCKVDGRPVLLPGQGQATDDVLKALPTESSLTAAVDLLSIGMTRPELVYLAKHGALYVATPSVRLMAQVLPSSMTPKEVALEMLLSLKFLAANKAGEMVNRVFEFVDVDLARPKPFSLTDAAESVSPDTPADLVTAQRMVNGYLWRLLPLQPRDNNGQKRSDGIELRLRDYMKLPGLLADPSTRQGFYFEHGFFTASLCKAEAVDVESFVAMLRAIPKAHQVFVADRLGFADIVTSQARLGLKLDLVTDDDRLAGKRPRIVENVGRPCQWKIAAALYEVCVLHLKPVEGYALPSYGQVALYQVVHALRHYFKADGYVVLNGLWLMVRIFGHKTAPLLKKMLVYLVTFKWHQSWQALQELVGNGKDVLYGLPGMARAVLRGDYAIWAWLLQLLQVAFHISKDLFGPHLRVWGIYYVAAYLLLSHVWPFLHYRLARRLYLRANPEVPQLEPSDDSSAWVVVVPKGLNDQLDHWRVRQQRPIDKRSPLTSNKPVL